MKPINYVYMNTNGSQERVSTGKYVRVSSYLDGYSAVFKTPKLREANSLP